MKNTKAIEQFYKLITLITLLLCSNALNGENRFEITGASRCRCQLKLDLSGKLN